MKEYEKVVKEESYRGRSIIIERKAGNGFLRDWMTGYIQVFPDDTIFKMVVDEDAERINRELDSPVEINFAGHLLYPDDAVDLVYIGFDTMHYGMDDFTEYMCEEYLIEIERQIEDLNHGNDICTQECD